MLLAVTVLFMMQAAGEVLARLTGLPLPGPLIGMLLMLVALMAYGRVPTGLRDTCHHMLKHLMLLFVPLVAGIMLYFGPLESEWIPFLLACIVGVALTIIVTAVTLRWMIRITGRSDS
ncbi:CidA/LrgA family protein [Pollutimonas harenae]|uniref:CidA/LrgA family protein n=1 Tax=Pollutimonas harenae TaxID=657015 RepID=A0A853GV25_9BURK|nr:CidA/LrgA family protein [Pollutimonas harenae]NYT86151.1 CidA/LrgA family protein [Pollutimonas harenae]TEA71549.1 CidA/LrgA family protein [Pollutimonas harenae]